MKKIAILFIAVFCFALSGQAQTYTDHVQQQQQGKGKVTIHQDKEISNLVNGIGLNTATPTTTPANGKNIKKETPSVPSVKKNHPTEKTAATTKRENDKPHTAEPSSERINESIALKEKAEKEKEARHAEARKPQSDDDNEMNIPTIDMRKKVMVNGRKVTGYRVQAYAGGNKRTDKQRAQQIGEAIKMRFPDQPVYVHFYSPRWICRVGNFRSYQDAARMLNAVKAMGYRSATIVRGKITVFD